MIARWHRFVAWVGRPTDAWPLLLVRAFVPLALMGDLLDMAWRGAMDAALYPARFGGIESRPDDLYLLVDVPWGGVLLFALVLLSAPLVAAGIATRPALVALLVADAQLGHLFPGGDRGIDRILRTVLLILLFSRVTGPRPPARVPAWPSDLIRWLLMLVYLGAGMAKLRATGRWLDPGQPELYAILADPMGGRLDPVAWRGWWVPFWIGGAATLGVELTSPLILTRWATYWALVAAPIHVGIALTMDLGMFSYGMLGLYPVIIRGWGARRLTAEDAEDAEETKEETGA